MNEVIYEWIFSNEKKRGSFWYIIALSIVIGLVIWGFLTRQSVMSFLIILVSGVYFFVENNSEDEIKVSLTNLGVKINNNFYDYSKIYSFGIFYEGDIASILRLNLNSKSVRIIDLKIENKDAFDIKQILKNYVKEEENLEFSFVEKIIYFLKL